MRLGFVIPQVGYEVGATSTQDFVRAIEQAGYGSAWVLDRLLFPVSPSEQYPASADGKLPDAYKRVLDPLALLSFAAACSSKLNIGSSILNLAWYNPALLARQLASIDVLSQGRLKLGVGTGWCPEEYEAVGVEWKTRGKRTDESIDLMRTLWSDAEPAYSGNYSSVPASVIDLKPVQSNVPIYMAAYTPPAMKRIAQKGDGWMPAGIPVSAMAQMFGGIRQMADDAGRDPQTLEMIVRANVTILPQPLGADRVPFVGSIDEIREDIAATREIGAHELLFDPQFSPDVADLSDLRDKIDQLMELARQ
tara:strand:+ start:40219 stop:41139 length:921 start_codon:yes stop_codon:yes gene_type:complete